MNAENGSSANTSIPMNGDRDDDLTKVFRSLVAKDSKSVPDFNLPNLSNAEPRTWRMGAGTYAIGIAAAIAVSMLFFSLQSPNGAGPSKEEAIAFEDLSEVISIEIFVASATEWKSPTSFLLNSDFKSPTEFNK
jgi:hypothetical protein